MLKIRSTFITAIAMSLMGMAYADHRSVSLDGDWEFALPEAKESDNWDHLPVPASWNTFTEYADYVGDAWYRREIKIPKEWKKQRIYLQFDAVYDIADVWINGTYLGQHTGGYSPFEFEVTEQVRPGRTAVITVKANNEHDAGAWFQWGGLNRSVHLFAREDLRLIRQKIEPTLDLKPGTARVRLLVTVANSSDQERTVRVSGVIRELDDTGFNLSGTVVAHGEAVLSGAITLNSEQTRIWHFDDPQLYHLKTVLLQQGKEIDRLEDRFGIRRVEIKPDGLYLNGEKVRLMGYNRVHDHRAYGNTEPRFLVRADIDMMKRSGANFSRIMHAPSAPDLLDYCDEAGYLIWSEIPIWQRYYRTPMDNQEDADNAADALPGIELREMMERDWNHPCIIGWSPGNELTQEADLYVQAMRPVTKAIDSTRFYANVHNKKFDLTTDGGSWGINANYVDLLLINHYSTMDSKIQYMLDQHDAVPNLPIFYSEFGEVRGEPLSHGVDFSPMWERLGQEEYVIGGAHWTFNDYRSYWSNQRTATPASQNRDWGAVDVWRNPKKLYYQFSKLQQPVHSMNVSVKENTAVVTIQPRKKLEIPSFTLRGYFWAYELLDSEGRVLDGGLKTLKNMAPDSKAVKNTIAWETTTADLLVISLISHNGYTVAETRIDLATGDLLPLPDFPEPNDPDVRKVLPLDRSFMVGVTSQDGDTGLEVRYGTAAGIYEQSLAAPVMGCIRVRGLENGTAYYGQVRRRMKDEVGPWSPEFTVVPDGGLPPAAPVILGMVRGDHVNAVRLAAQEKVCGYEVTLASGEIVQRNVSRPGLLLVPTDSVQLAVIGEYGVSEKTKL